MKTGTKLSGSALTIRDYLHSIIKEKLLQIIEATRPIRTVSGSTGLKQLQVTAKAIYG